MAKMYKIKRKSTGSKMGGFWKTFTASILISLILIAVGIVITAYSLDWADKIGDKTAGDLLKEWKNWVIPWRMLTSYVV